MALNQKVEENRTPLEFNFTYWEIFSALYTAFIEPDYNLFTTSMADNWTKLKNKQVHVPFLQSKN